MFASFALPLLKPHHGFLVIPLQFIIIICLYTDFLVTNNLKTNWEWSFQKDFTELNLSRQTCTLCISVETILFYNRCFCLYYGVTKSDRNLRKTRNVFKNLRFRGKRKDCTRKLTRILKRLTFTRLQAFCLHLVTFEMLNSSPVSVWIAIFYIAYISTTSLTLSRGCKFLPRIPYEPRTFELSLLEKLRGWWRNLRGRYWREGESTCWSLPWDGRQICSDNYRYGGKFKDRPSVPISYNLEVRSTFCVRHVLLEQRIRSFIIHLFFTALFYSVTNRIFFIGTSSDLPRTFFCNTCLFVTLLTSFDVAGANIILLHSEMASKSIRYTVIAMSTYNHFQTLPKYGIIIVLLMYIISVSLLEAETMAIVPGKFLVTTTFIVTTTTAELIPPSLCKREN